MARRPRPPVAMEPAVWTPKEIQFTYMGFTTHYTCDGLRDTIKEMLLQLGARKDDLKVTEQPCAGNPDRPNPFPRREDQYERPAAGPGDPEPGQPGRAGAMEAGEIALPGEPVSARRGSASCSSSSTGRSCRYSRRVTSTCARTAYRISWSRWAPSCRRKS